MNIMIKHFKNIHADLHFLRAKSLCSKVTVNLISLSANAKIFAVLDVA